MKSYNGSIKLHAVRKREKGIENLQWFGAIEELQIAGRMMKLWSKPLMNWERIWSSEKVEMRRRKQSGQVLGRCKSLNRQFVCGALHLIIYFFRKEQYGQSTERRIQWSSLMGLFSGPGKFLGLFRNGPWACILCPFSVHVIHNMIYP